MLSGLRKMIGSINVEEEGNFIRIEGLPTYQYINDLARLWKTSKIGLNMFSKVTSSYVVFHKFFLPEVLYTLQGALDDPKRGYSFNYRAMRKAVDELQRETWWRHTQETHPDILDYSQLDKLTKVLFDYQQEFLHIYNERVPKLNLGGYILAADPGTGKTINSIALATCLRADVVVAIVPKNAVDRVWKATLDTIFKTPVDYWLSSTDEPLQWGKKYYVFHYEQLDRAVEFMAKHPGTKPMVILDESHNMNDIDSLRTQLFIKLCRDMRCKHVLWMSGTPIKAMGKEVVPVLKTIDAMFDKTAEERFLAIFGKSSAKGLDILANRLGMFVHKVKKVNPVTNVVERVEMKVATPKGKQFTLANVSEEMRQFVAERTEYYRINFKKYEGQYEQGLKVHEKVIAHNRQAQTDYAIYQRYILMIRAGYDPESMIAESKYCNRYEKEIAANLAQPLREQFRNAKSVVKYCNLKIQGEALGRILGKRRMQCNLELAEHINFEEEIDGARKKTIIFTSYVEVVDKVFERLTAQGYSPARVYGLTNKDLPNIIGKFEKDPDCNPLIATFQSLSTAVPLTMASTTFMLNSPFRIGEMEQAEARMDRVGQDGSVKFINVFLDTGGEPNLSTRSNDILVWSKEQVSKIMGIAVVDDVTTESLFSDQFQKTIDHWLTVTHESDSIEEELIFINELQVTPVVKPLSLGW